MKYLFMILALTLPAMAGREFVSGSSRMGAGVITPIDPPLTICLWSRPTQNSAALVSLSLQTTTNNFERLLIYQSGNAAGDPWAYGAEPASGVGGSFVNSTTSSVINQWDHVALVVESSTLRTLYVNGTPASTNTTSVALNGLDYVLLGVTFRNTLQSHWTGQLAEVAVYSSALTAPDVASLAAGASPSLVKPASLAFYSPLTGQNASDDVNLCGSLVNLTNSPAASLLHPRIYRP